MKIPWGKFKGQDIESVPSSYIRWMAENLDETKPRNRELCIAADKEYQWREKNDAHID